MLRRISFLALMLLVVPALLALGACGGDDDGDDTGGTTATGTKAASGEASAELTAYMQKMDDIDKDLDTQFEESVFTDASDTAAKIQEGFITVAEDALKQYKAVDAPSEVKDKHQALVDAITDTIAEIKKVKFDATAAPDEFESAVFGDETTAAGKANARVEAAFCDLQDIADAAGLDNDVGCDRAVDPTTVDAVETNEVQIEGFSFGPPHIQVKVGDTVTWTEGADPAPHTATADDASFDSDILKKEGDTFEYTFDKAGDYSYHCTVHPDMLGLVTVVK